MAELCLFAEFGDFLLGGENIGARHNRVVIEHCRRPMPSEVAGDHLWDAGGQQSPRARSAKIVE